METAHKKRRTRNSEIRGKGGCLGLANKMLRSSKAVAQNITACHAMRIGPHLEGPQSLPPNLRLGFSNESRQKPSCPADQPEGLSSQHVPREGIVSDHRGSLPVLTFRTGAEASEHAIEFITAKE